MTSSIPINVEKADKPKKAKQYLYSEIFYSIQGEGFYTGRVTAWLRFFLCNLQCNGFGQKDPTDESSYVLPYKDYDVSEAKSMSDLPVWKYGCDSSYSWSKKFKKLQQMGSPEQIADRVRDSLKNEWNPDGQWRNMHMCFTGGEPLMKHAQDCSVDMIRYWMSQGDYPKYITYETNGTQPLTEDFIDFFNNEYDGELFMSVSPKLWTVAGEKRSRAIQPEIVGTYRKLTSAGQLKYVANGEERSWKEVEEVTEMMRDNGVDWEVYIMPVGARVEDQELCAGDVAAQAMKRGYHVAARVHTYLFGNAIGT